MKAEQYLVNCLKRGLVSAVGATALFTANTAGAQVVVDEAIRPYVLAPYVLQRSILEPRPDDMSGGTFAYRPWFENGAWTGDLIQYIVRQDGKRIPRDDIGFFPGVSETGWRGDVHPTPWSARYAFDDWTFVQTPDGGLTCVEENTDAWLADQRKVITFAYKETRPFLWDELSQAQRAAIDAGLAADAALEDEPYASGILNFLRGDRSNEACKGGQFRMRYSLLGAVINSRPVYVPPVGSNTHGVVVVGANAGMLHGFSAADGEELFAYVPSILMGKLSGAAFQNYRTYFVDGELRHRDVGVPATASVPGTTRHIVAGGLGAGGRGMFVLDVTAPSSPIVVREISGSNTSYTNEAPHDIFHAEFGYIQGRPVIAQLNDATGIEKGWYVITGNGYDSADNSAKLALIPLDPSREPVFLNTDGALNNGLSAPALVDINGDGFADIAYAGDLLGRMWRFDLRTGALGASATLTSPASPRVVYDAGPLKPITAEPDVAEHPRLGGHMVFFGTGKLLSADDISTDPPRQSVYGIWDRGLATDSTLTDASTAMIQQTLVSLTDTRTLPVASSPCLDAPVDAIEGISSATLRIVPTPVAPVWGSPHRGWRVDLPRAAERIVRAVQVRAERVQFVTTNPVDMRERDATPEAGSWMMQLDMETGGSPANVSKRRALFDLNKNCTLDTGDAVNYLNTVTDTTSSHFPIGINLGAFNIAQPAFARVRFDSAAAAVIDGVYINALELPIQEVNAPPLSLPIDVTTDVPIGPASTARIWHQYDSTDKYFPGRDGWYPEPVRLDTGTPQRALKDATGPIKPYLGADGPGNRVNGHSSGYNRIHDVNYVDFINLEPRRGQLRLDVGSVFEDVDSTCEVGSTETDCTIKQINPRRAEPELHRVTEVLSKDQDFIVMVTNADLSQKNEIRIGCRTWPVYEYQTMMMGHLRGITTLRAANQADLETPGDRGFGKDVTGFRDDNNVSLIVRLSDFYDAEGEQRICPDQEPATLRITVTSTRPEIRNMHGTLPGCVVNTHDYEGNLKPNADSAPATELYNFHPHVTPNLGHKGFRWRNGALTVQLLAVNSGVSAFQLQSRRDWPVGERLQGVSPVEGQTVGFGGAYAWGVQSIFLENKIVRATPRPNDQPNGLLYESSIFWHYGDLHRFANRGNTNAQSPRCYPEASTGMVNNEIGGFGPSEYKGLVEDFSETQQAQYAFLLDEIARGINLEANIQALQDLFKTVIGDKGAQKALTIADYHRLRIYVPNSRVHPDDLIPIDRENSTFGRDGGTPVEVSDIERDLLPSLGPNYQPGRRSWIDLTPEEPTP